MSQTKQPPKTLQEAIHTLEENQPNSAAGFEEELLRLKNALDDLSKKVTHAVDQGVDSAKQAGQEIDNRVRDNPWLAIGIVAAIAFLLGLLINRRD